MAVRLDLYRTKEMISQQTNRKYYSKIKPSWYLDLFVLLKSLFILEAGMETGKGKSVGSHDHQCKHNVAVSARRLTSEQTKRCSSFIVI